MNTTDALNRVKKMLKETNYGVQVKGTDNGCILTLPKKQLAPRKKSQTIKYEILKGGCVNITGDIDSYWLCPDYVARCSIYLDILKKCEEYDFSPLVILYSNEEYDDANSILEILPAPEGVQLNQELKTLDLANILIENNTIGVLVELREEAERLEILDGFNFIVAQFCGKVFK